MPNLKQTLLLDAASAVLFIVLCLGFTDAIVAMTGLPQSVVLAAGWICVPCAALFTHQALYPARALIGVIVWGNVGWVLASIGVWLAHWSALTPLGHAVVVGQALAVEAFAFLEWRGLKAMVGRPAAA